MNKKYFFLSGIIFLVSLGLIFFSQSEDPLSILPSNLLNKTAEVKDQISFHRRDYSHKEYGAKGFIESFYNDLPNLEDLNHISEREIHNTPAFLFRGAEILSNILEAGNKDNSKRKSALEFLKRCAEDSKIINSMRALCLKQVYHFIQVWHEPISIERELISKDVEQITEKML